MPATSVMAHERHIPNRNGSLRCALFAASNIPSTGHDWSRSIWSVEYGDNRTERMSY